MCAQAIQALTTNEPLYFKQPGEEKKFPTDLYMEIFSHLGPQDLAATAGVCKHFNAISQNDCLWAPKVFSTEKTFKKVFIEKYQNKKKISELEPLIKKQAEVENSKVKVKRGFEVLGAALCVAIAIIIVAALFFFAPIPMGALIVLSFFLVLIGLAVGINGGNKLFDVLFKTSKS